MAGPLITDEDNASAERHPGLGAAYHPAGRIAAELVKETLANEAMQAAVREAAGKVSDAAFDAISSSIWGGALERNMQHMAYQLVDEVVAAILSGNKLYARMYALGEYDQQGVREAVAALIGDEVAKKRIEDLEAEVAKLQEDLTYLRRFR